MRAVGATAMAMPFMRLCTAPLHKCCISCCPYAVMCAGLWTLPCRPRLGPLEELQPLLCPRPRHAAGRP
eukprot:1158555-Pelagomonas_calceolata.AAC.8